MVDVLLYEQYITLQILHRGVQEDTMMNIGVFRGDLFNLFFN